MSHHVLLVQLAVADGAEAAYRAWHDHHLEQIANEVPGFSSAQRFEADPATDPPGITGRFIAIYEIAGDPQQALAELGRAREVGRVAGPPPGVIEASATTLYVPAGTKLPGLAAG